MGLLDEIRKALESQQKSDFIDQILKEKSLHDALHDAGFTIVVDDPQARARQQPFGLLSTIQKIDLIDLIEVINRIKLIDEITLISTIATVGSMTLLDRITQLDKIHPDPTGGDEKVGNGGFETGSLSPWTGTGTVVETVAHHSGLYACLLEQYSSTNYIEQLISVVVNDVATFGFWAYHIAGAGTLTKATVTYTDTSTSIHDFNTAGMDYVYCDIVPYLTAGKTIQKLRLEVFTEDELSWVDDVSLVTVLGDSTVINRVDNIVSMPAITGSVTVKGSENQLLLQRALTYDLIVQLRSAGVEIDPRAIRALTAADIVTVLCSNLDVALSTRFKPTDSIGNTSFGATQATRTSLKVQPEREDIVSLGGVASPSAAGVEIVPASGSLVPKVYDAEYEGFADGLHYFYFGTSTSPTTKRFLSRGTKGVNSKTFVQPRVGAAGDGIYLYSSVAETNMPYDLGYKLE
jgi:hypothetical protein